MNITWSYFIINWRIWSSFQFHSFDCLNSPVVPVELLVVSEVVPVDVSYVVAVLPVVDSVPVVPIVLFPVVPVPVVLLPPPVKSELDPIFESILLQIGGVELLFVLPLNECLLLMLVVIAH